MVRSDPRGKKSIGEMKVRIAESTGRGHRHQCLSTRSNMNLTLKSGEEETFRGVSGLVFLLEVSATLL